MSCDYFSFGEIRRGANIYPFYAKRIFGCFLFLCIYDVVLYDVYTSSYKATKKRKSHLECKYHKCCCFGSFYVYEKSPVTLCLGDFLIMNHELRRLKHCTSPVFWENNGKKGSTGVAPKKIKILENL